MKEKRVDVALAKAGFYQVIFYGFGGGFLTELVNYPNVKLKILLVAAFCTFMSAPFVHYFYSQATRLCKKTKHKTDDH